MSELRPAPTPADAELLAELADAHGVATVAPRPGVTAYGRDLLLGILRTIAEWLDAFWTTWSTATGVAAVTVAYVVVAAAVSVVVILVLRTLQRRRARRARDVPADDGDPVAAPRPTLDAGTLDAELERLLAAGEVGAALHALWDWLATVLVGPSADPAWTSRELALAAGRRDLLPAVRRFDRLLYGPSTPSAVDVRGLRGDLGNALAPDGVAKDSIAEDER